jgi:hypothetical protein
VYVSREVEGNRFEIAGGRPGLKVSWQVTGIRKDPFAEQNRVIPEVEKQDGERGLYLYPEAYGLPATRAIHHDSPKADGLRNVQPAQLSGTAPR